MNRMTTNPLLECSAEYGDAQLAIGPSIDMHATLKTGNLPSGLSAETSSELNALSTSWLPFAAESYNISRDMRDYVMVPTLIFATEIPNSNLCAFPYDEMACWNPGAGELAYATWRRKACHVEHANSDHTRAKGLIFDASMRRAPEYAGGLHRVVLLAGWDRSRDPALASRIAAGRTGFSMGSWVERYQCSVCTANLKQTSCDHFYRDMRPRMAVTAKNQLVYRVARGVTGFELSAVQTPAYRAAVAESIG